MAPATVAGGEPPACESLGDVTSANRQAAGELQRSVEAGALFSAAAAGTGVQGCSVWHAGGSVELLYRFRSGGQFTAKRDPAIELTEQRAKLALPPAEDPLRVLRRAERQAFGEQGCGIDWAHPDTDAAQGEPGAIDTVWQGQTCNCRARARRDALGAVIELALSSAC
ncbi:hypothetical protein [Ideonella sp.]|uniref:hypothetical protein n=1 Tax=Ideonella sp. TaxID=1929293 RepID=UPI0035B45374